MDIGQRLRELMRLHSIKTPALAKNTGIPAQTLYSIMHRDDISVGSEIIGKLCEYFSVSPNYFFGWQDGQPALELAWEQLTPQNRMQLVGYIQAMLDQQNGVQLWRQYVGAPIAARGGISVAGEEMARALANLHQLLDAQETKE